eukprot:3226906-Prymnesium_polylepis.1
MTGGTEGALDTPEEGLGGEGTQTERRRTECARRPGHVLIPGSALVTAPPGDGRKEGAKHIKT